MADPDLGEATIVYEDPDKGTVKRTVQNERIAYFQDHWTFKAGEDEDGNDIVRRIPHQRVHYVERSVEAFEDELDSLQQRIQSVAEDLRTKLLGSSESTGESEPYRIEVESGEEKE